MRRSSKARYVRIHVGVDEGVVVVLPRNMPEKTGLEFAKEKMVWIRKSLNRQKKIQEQYSLFTEDSQFKTRMHSLVIQKHDRKTIKTRISTDKILVCYPDFADVKDNRIQSVIRKAIEETWYLEAKILLPQRVRELAELHKFSYNKLSIKNAKTRWGSCSSNNNINLNLQLMRLPDSLIDYVILHELTHTMKKHHQATFWKHLEKMIPDARYRDKELNNYNLRYW